MNWQLKPKAPSAFFKQFPEYSPLITQLLYSRGLKTQQQIDEFFNPDFQEDFHSPFLLKGMKKAVKRILEAVKQQEKITIYGDFDADGICASVIMRLTLEELGVNNFNVYIPERGKENHGLNEKSVKKLAQEGTKLIITVDCGSTNADEIDLANSLGLDVIITDHHEIGKKIPKAFALINALQKGDKYPFKKLSGAGIAYKLACALLSSKEKKSENPLKKWLLDLVALATVADVEPIIGENRTLVKYGLGVLAQTKWLGLEELMKVAQVNPQLTQPSLNGEAPVTNLNTRTLGYVLGPRINAASRMDHANNALYLLIAKDRNEAVKLAQDINQKNLDRQNLTAKIFREVKDRLNKKFDKDKIPKLIFEGSPNWPMGMIGLIAGKAADKYRRPSIIYCENDGIIHASCRSIPQFDLMEMLNQAADYFNEFGGREGAGGFRVKKENLDKVRKILSQIAEKELKDENLIPYLDIDAELSLKEISWQNYDQIQRFAPFGKANSEPMFLAEGLEISDLRIVGNNGRHLKMELIMFDTGSASAKNFKAIGFGLGEWERKLKKGDLIDVVFELIIDEWNSRRDLQLKIIDIKLSD